MRGETEEKSKTLGQRLAGFRKRVFPHRELTFRTDGRIRFFRISSAVQISLVVLLMAAGGWAAFASASYVLNIEIIKTKDGEILNARMAYRSLLSEVSDYQKKFAVLTGELEKNHGLMLNLVERNSDLKQSLKTTANRLVSSKVQIREIAVKSEIGTLNKRNFKLKGNLTSIATNLEDVLLERNTARKEGARLAKQVVKLQGKLVDLRNSEVEILARLAERARENNGEMTAILAKTGLRMSALMGKSKLGASGQGGPFIATSPAREPALVIAAALTELDARLTRWEDLKHLMRIMPLASPLDYFSISSRYGKRRDPISRKWAMHYGLDFGSFFRAPVYATAPGVVTYAGRKGKYGKLVEITHGKGLKTRYGHLHKILVKRGQKVDYRKKIGLLGNTGRSTGAHLHYEVHHKGRPRNPWKFIRAGKDVYKG